MFVTKLFAERYLLFWWLLLLGTILFFNYSIWSSVGAFDITNLNAAQEHLRLQIMDEKATNLEQNYHEIIDQKTGGVFYRKGNRIFTEADALRLTKREKNAIEQLQLLSPWWLLGEWATVSKIREFAIVILILQFVFILMLLSAPFGSSIVFLAIPIGACVAFGVYCFESFSFSFFWWATGVWSTLVAVTTLLSSATFLTDNDTVVAETT